MILFNICSNIFNFVKFVIILFPVLSIHYISSNYYVSLILFILNINMILKYYFLSFCFILVYSFIVWLKIFSNNPKVRRKSWYLFLFKLLAIIYSKIPLFQSKILNFTQIFLTLVYYSRLMYSIAGYIRFHCFHKGYIFVNIHCIFYYIYYLLSIYWSTYWFYIFCILYFYYFQFQFHL